MKRPYIRFKPHFKTSVLQAYELSRKEFKTLLDASKEV